MPLVLQRGSARLRAGRVAALTRYAHVSRARNTTGAPFTPAPFESPYSVDNQQGRPDGVALLIGAPAGIRTPDTLLKRQVLCRLSYWGKWGG